MTSTSSPPNASVTPPEPPAAQRSRRWATHANLATTELYLGTPTLDEIASAMSVITLGTAPEPEHTFHVPDIQATKPEKAPTGIEPVYTALQAAA
jgi:hypothetical protein